MTNKSAKLYAIGTGPGDPELITVKAAKALASSDCIFEVISADGRESISGSVAREYASEKAEFIKLLFPMVSSLESKNAAWKKNASEMADALKNAKTCSFVTIGDPSLYSTFSYLMKELKEIYPDAQVEIIPGITAIQCAAAKAQIPLAEDTELLTIIPAYSMDNHKNLEEIFKSSANVAIMKSFKSRTELSTFIKTLAPDTVTVFASRLGLEGETICTDINKVDSLPEEYLSLFIVKQSGK